MNWTLPNSTQTSPGFVYFNNSAPNNNHDFIPFNESPPPASQQHRFGPQGYSTPQNHYQHNRRGYHKQRNNNWNQNRFSGRNNRSFNSSPSEPKFDNNYLIKAKFVHQSFLENPWAELEKKLEQERKSKQESGGDSPQGETSTRKRSRDMCD